MSTLTLTPTKLQHGIWEGLVQQSGTGTPRIRVTHQDAPIPNVEIKKTDTAGQWHVLVPVPNEAICDGVQVFVLTDEEDETTLGHFVVIAGEAVGDDLRSEIDMLRAELDLLKRAFRRHCAETS